MSEILTADVLASDATDGEVRCTLGDAVKGLGFATEAAIYSGPLVYRPSEPDSNGDAPTALYVQDSDDAQVIAVKDTRYAEKVGTLEAGDWGLITDSEARIFCKSERDAIVLYTADSNGHGMMIDLGGTEKEIKIINAGKTFLTMTQDSITMGVDGGGMLIIDADGVRAIGGSFQAVAPMVQLGDMGGGTPPPASPASAVAYTVASPPNIVSTKVFVAS